MEVIHRHQIIWASAVFDDPSVPAPLVHAIRNAMREVLMARQMVPW